MTGNVLLSGNIRTNLLALQNTSDLLATAQAHLATGKKVNSALDDASSFFTASKLSDKATALNGLLNGISNGIQTIQAANQGATSVVSLLKTAQGIAQQAKAAATSSGYSATSATAQTSTTGTTLAQQAGNATLATTANGVAAGDVLQFSSTKGTGANAVTTTFKYTVGGADKINDLVNAINSSGVATAKINDNGTLAFSSAGNLSITATQTSGTQSAGQAAATSILGFAATGGVISTAAGAASASTVDYTAQFRDVMTQIDKTVQDSGYNGINLLAGGVGNSMTVKFDDKSDSALSVSSTDISASTGLAGLSNYNTATLDSSSADGVLTNISNAISTVQNLTGQLGNKLSLIQNRQDFTKNISNILQTGSDNLTAADPNQEAATVLALQNRQSLSQSALSLANQQNQGVLQLLR